MRTPSEHLALKRGDMDWERERFLVRSPKTGPRWVPMFPELRPHLDAALKRSETGAEHVVARTRDAGANWRTTFVKIMKRAGLVAWEKPFQNLRASRETELVREHPIQVVTAWIGNSVSVAAAHYLQVTDADFARAVKRNGGGAAVGSQATGTAGEPAERGDAESDARATQNPPQTGANAGRPKRTEVQQRANSKGVCTLPSAPASSCLHVQYPEKESNLHDRVS